MKKIAIPSIVLIFLISCSQPKKQAIDLLLTNATIVDVKSGELIADQLIAITGDTILAVSANLEREKYTTEKTIDLKGNYVIPGLWDNHVHFRGGDSLITENKNLLPLFLRYGVTTVRDAGGDITPTVLEWRKQINENKLDGPTIFTPGPKLDGPNPAWEGSIKITSQEDIIKALDSLQAIDADFVKTYDGSLTEEMYYAIIEEADKRDMQVTGHMPMSAYFEKAIEKGVDGAEHMYYVMKACTPVEDSLTALDQGYGILNQIVNTYDEKTANEIYNKMAENQVFITPTLFIGKTLAHLADENHSQDSLLKYIGKGIQQTYQRRLLAAQRAKAAGNNFRLVVNEKAMSMILPMQNAGVPILAGSDCGPYNSFVYPGASLHGELQSLVAAGLTPQQAIATSIINGPKFFGLEDNYGSVAPGKKADLLILDKNPLDNISNLQHIEGIINHGKYHSKEHLQQQLDNLKE